MAQVRRMRDFPIPVAAGVPRLAAVENLWASSLMDPGAPCPVLASAIVEREARLATSQMMLTSEQHARLMEIYGKPDPDSSPELVRRKQRLAHYHAMLAKAALKREPLKANPNRRFSAPNPSDEGQLAFGF